MNEEYSLHKPETLGGDVLQLAELNLNLIEEKKNEFLRERERFPDLKRQLNFG